MALSVAADCKRLSVSSMWSVSLREVVSAVGLLLVDKKIDAAVIKKLNMQT